MTPSLKEILRRNATLKEYNTETGDILLEIKRFDSGTGEELDPLTVTLNTSSLESIKATNASKIQQLQEDTANIDAIIEKYSPGSEETEE